MTPEYCNKTLKLTSLSFKTQNSFPQFVEKGKKYQMHDTLQGTLHYKINTKQNVQ